MIDRRGHLLIATISIFRLVSTKRTGDGEIKFNETEESEVLEQNIQMYV